jgi:hypothetical protein
MKSMNLVSEDVNRFNGPRLHLFWHSFLIDQAAQLTRNCRLNFFVTAVSTFEGSEDPFEDFRHVYDFVDER